MKISITMKHSISLEVSDNGLERYLDHLDPYLTSQEILHSRSNEYQREKKTAGK